MRKMRKIVAILSVVVTLALVAGILPMAVLADGSYDVSSQYIELHPGESATVTLSADNAAGRVDWSSDGPVSAAGSAYLDNDTKTIQIDADAVGTGTVYITPTDIATYDNEELTNGYQIQVVVLDPNADQAGDAAASSVVQDNPEPQQAEAPAEEETPAPEEPAPEETPAAEEAPAEEAPAEETPAEETPAPEAAGDVLTDGNNDYEQLSENDRLYTSVNDVELYIIQYPRWMDEAGNEVWNDEIVGLDMLTGFNLVTVNYKGVNVDTFQKDDYTVFVLKNLETDVCGYYTLKADGTGFEQLSYITANGKQYIVVDFPEDFVIPEGYQMVEMNFGATKIHALKQVPEGAPAPEPVNVFPEEETTAAEPEAPAEEAPAEAAPAEVVPEGEGMSLAPAARNAQIVIDERISVALKGYETQISPGLDSADPSGDIYYIYCLVDGQKQLYSYDAAEGTLQRASIVVYNEIPTEPETVIVYRDPVEPETQADTSGGFLKGIGWNNMQIQVKVLLIALAVAILLIVVLIILFAVMSKRNKKRNRRSTRGRGRSTIPPRSANRTAPLNNIDDDDAFFSYVKTDDYDDYDDYYRN